MATTTEMASAIELPATECWPLMIECWPSKTGAQAAAEREAGEV
jgi:hypothetical protein